MTIVKKRAPRKVEIVLNKTERRKLLKQVALRFAKCLRTFQATMTARENAAMVGTVVTDWIGIVQSFVPGASASEIKKHLTATECEYQNFTGSLKS